MIPVENNVCYCIPDVPVSAGLRLLLLIAPSKRLREKQPGRSAQPALDAEDGGREGEDKSEKDFFFPLVTKAVHTWEGPGQAIYQRLNW